MPGSAIVKEAAFQMDVCDCGHFAFVCGCAFALCVLLSMPHGHHRQKALYCFSQQDVENVVLCIKLNSISLLVGLVYCCEP